MIGDLVPSLIRTYVPVIVGAFFAWLVTSGIDVDATAQTALVTALTALLTGVYYTGVRLLEKQWPQLGFLLGINVQPQYGNVAATKNDNGGYQAEEYSPYPEGTPVEITQDHAPALKDDPNNNRAV